jgi:hypothetical protein
MTPVTPIRRRSDIRVLITKTVGIAIARRIELQHTTGMRAEYVASCRKSDLSRRFPIAAIAAGKKKARLPTSHFMMVECISWYRTTFPA